MPLLNMQ